MRLFLLVFHVLITLCMIGVILLQKGEEISAGGKSSMYSPGKWAESSNRSNPLTRITAILATLFFVNCVGLALLVKYDVQTMAPKTVMPLKAAPTKG